MEFLAIHEVESIVKLLADAGDPTVERSIADRKQILLDGLCRLIDSDAYIWSLFRAEPTDRSNLMALSFVDGGWRDPFERARLFEALVDPRFVGGTHARVFEALEQDRHLTLLRDEMVPPDVWSRHGETWLKTGFEQFVLTIYPLGPSAGSAIGFHRRQNRPAFSERDRLIVHVVTQQVDWLHRDGSDAPAGDHILELSPRERQVMLLLMHGESQKEIARHMKLSPHTVGDYIKQINKRFGVSSRTELLAQFISGSTSKRRP